jgi:hypothetical protein
MAEIKNTFTSGRMNKDLDERLLPNTEYRDALNVNISTSEGANVGAVENLLGNEKISKITDELENPKVIGSIKWDLEEKLYWFLTSEYLDAIYEYNQTQNKVEPVIVDIKNKNAAVLNGVTIKGNVNSQLLIKDFNKSEIEAVISNTLKTNKAGEQTVTKNTLYLTNEVFDIDIQIPQNTIIEYTKDSELLFYDVTYEGNEIDIIDVDVTYVYNSILNFNKNGFITGINIIDGILFWTDDFNQPRKIDIKKFKKYTNANPNIKTQINGQAFSEKDISVAKKAPLSAPSLELQANPELKGQYIVNKKLNFENKKINDRFTISWSGDNIQWKVGDIVNMTPVSGQSTTLTAELEVFSIVDSSRSGYKSISLKILTLSEDPDANDYTFELKKNQGKSLYELKFPRFSYRWKYKDGEYSTLSPFSEVAFLPGTLFSYNNEEGFNTAMTNEVRKIKLSNIELGDNDVEEIQIVYKDSSNANIYTVDKKKKSDFKGVYELEKEQIHAIIENNQLLRQWDNVPRKAKAQEVTANRIIYGNYLQNYNVTNDVVFEVSRDDYPINPNTAGQKTVKSNRNYQIGVVYIDEFNRQSPVFSNPTGSLKIGKEFSANANAIKAKITSPAPAWATHFKYFIKEVSNEYYNLAIDRAYQQEDDPNFVWLSFSSADINKINKEDYIILKKQHNTNIAVKNLNNRYKVLEIKAEPPIFLSDKKERVTALSDIKFGEDEDYDTTTLNKSPNATPTSNSSSIIIVKSDGENQIPETKFDLIKEGNFIKLSIGGEKTKFYKIASCVKNADDRRVRINIEGGLDNDVNFLYNNNDNGTPSLRSNISLEVHKKAADVNTAEFAGRFFVKIKNNNVIEDNIISKLSNTNEYISIQSANDITTKDLGPGKNAPLYISHGGKKGLGTTDKRKPNSNKKFKLKAVVNDGSLRNISGSERVFDITLEQGANDRDDSFCRAIEIGSKIRFSTHPSIIYNVDDFDRTTVRSQKEDVWQLSLKLSTKDNNGNVIQGLKEDIGTYNSDITPFSISIVKQKIGDEKFSTLNPAIFETEPKENKTDLDLYYETQDSYAIDVHGEEEQKLRWFNAFNFISDGDKFNGVESNRIRDDFNAPVIDKGVRVSTTLEQDYKEDRVRNGLIYSGIINSKSNVNESNQFIQALNITKELLPSFGSIQKLYARDTDLVALCEDKIVKIYADKDILFNADGSSNVTASNLVLGTAVPFTGEYGIGLNPESFAVYGYRIYFADAVRGAILRLSMDGLTDISMAGMNDFFKDRLAKYNTFIGSYDDYNDCYNLSIPCLDTTCFSESAGGWTSRKSFIPESALSLNNKFYTYKNGELWKHESDTALRNNFYGVQYISSLQYVINQDASVVKKFRTLGYEGTKDWKAKLESDQNKSSVLSFIEKENKYFSNINGEKKTIDNIDLKNFSVQGIGKPSEVSSVGTKTKKTFKIKLVPKTITGFSCDKPIVNETGIAVKETTVSFDSDDTLAKIEIQPKDGYDLDPDKFKIKGVNLTKDGDNVVGEIPVADLDKIVKDNDESNFIEDDTIIVDGIESNTGNGQPYSPPADDTEAGIDQTFEIQYDGTAEEKEFTVSGNYNSSLTNATISTASGAYEVSNTKHRNIQVVKRKITPDSGYEIKTADITCANDRVTFTTVKNSDGTIDITEFILIKDYTEKGLDYTIELDAIELVTPIPEIIDVICPGSVPRDGDEIQVTIIGDSGSKGDIVLLNEDNDETDRIPFEITEEDNGQKDVEVDIPSSSEDTEVKIVIDLDETNFENDDAQEPKVIEQKDPEINNIKFSAASYNFSTDITYAANTVNTQQISGHKNESANGIKTLKWEIGPPSGVTWSEIRDVQESDFVTVSGEANPIVYSNLSSEILTSGNTGYLQVTADVYVNEFLGDQEIILDIDNIVGKEVTLTFTYGVPGGVNYTYSTADDVTLTGNTGASIAPQTNNLILFKLTPGANRTFDFQSNIKTFLNDNFTIEENSTDVTSKYISGFEYQINNDQTISVGFKINKDIIYPSSDSTITFKPKTSSTFDTVNKIVSTTIINFYAQNTNENSVNNVTYISTGGNNQNLVNSFTDEVDVNTSTSITKTIVPNDGFTFEGAGTITFTTRLSNVTLGAGGVTSTIDDNGAISCTLPYTPTSANATIDLIATVPPPVRKIVQITVSSAQESVEDAAIDNIVEDNNIFTDGDPNVISTGDRVFKDAAGDEVIEDGFYSFESDVFKVVGGTITIIIDKTKINQGTKPIIESVTVTENTFTTFSVDIVVSKSGGASLSEVGITFDTIYQVPTGLSGEINLPVNTLNKGKYTETKTDLNVSAAEIDNRIYTISLNNIKKPTDHTGPLYVTKDGNPVSASNFLFEHTPIFYVKAFAKNTNNSDNISYFDTIQVKEIFKNAIDAPITTNTISNVKYIRKSDLLSYKQIGNWSKGYQATLKVNISDCDLISHKLITYGILISEENATPAFNSDFTLPSNVKMFVFPNSLIPTKRNTSAVVSKTIYNLTPNKTFYYRAFIIVKGSITSDIPYISNNNADVYPLGATLKTNWQGNGTSLRYGNALSVTTDQIGIPVVTTQDATNKTSTSAQLNGNVTNINGALLIEKGFVISRQGIPSIESNEQQIIIPGNTEGAFNKTLQNLQPGVNYRVRAYGEGENGIGYGDLKTFILVQATIPIVSTKAATSITETSVQLNGEIDFAGSDSITETGFVYLQGSNYSTGNFDLNFSGIQTASTTDLVGTFSKTVSDLQENSTYSFRAYAKSAAGTGYADTILTVKTNASTVLPSITINNISFENLTADLTGDIKLNATISNAVSFKNIGVRVMNFKGNTWPERGTNYVKYFYVNGFKNNNFTKNSNNITFLIKNEKLSWVGGTRFFQFFIENDAGTQYSNLQVLPPMGNLDVSTYSIWRDLRMPWKNTYPINTTWYFNSEYIKMLNISNTSEKITIEKGIPLNKNLFRYASIKAIKNTTAAPANSFIDKFTLKVSKDEISFLGTDIKNGLFAVQDTVTIEYPILVIGNDFVDGKMNLTL